VPLDWSLASAFSILINESENAWHAGRIRDLLILGPSDTNDPARIPILAASHSGGVWQITSSGAFPLSDDWERPNCECLGRGPLGSGHFLAGGEDFLYETDPTANDPLLSWRPVSLPFTPHSQKVLSIVSFEDPARIVIELEPSWLYWGTPKPTGGYDWREAKDEQGRPAFLRGLAAVEPTYVGFPWRHAIASFAHYAGTGLNNLVFGLFESGDLVLHAGTPIGFDPQIFHGFYDARLESCASDRRHVYAWMDDKALFRSGDGGVSWEQAGLQLGGAPAGADLVEFAIAGSPSPGGAPRRIGVSPVDPMVVAIGITRPLVSGNRGDTFVPLGGSWDSSGNYVQTTPHLHADINVLRFDPLDPQGRRLFIASDGGVSMVSDWTAHGVAWRCDYNQYLANLEFAGPLCNDKDYACEYDGSLGAGLAAGDRLNRLDHHMTQVMLAGGLQDNGNVIGGIGLVPFVALFGIGSMTHWGIGPWRQFEGGDGGYNAVLNIEKYAGPTIGGLKAPDVGAAIVHTSMGSRYPARFTTWEYNEFQNHGPIPTPGDDEGRFSGVRFSAVESHVSSKATTSVPLLPAR
jgi:hypothetical protein